MEDGIPVIKNGFVRGIDGEWFNMNKIAFFSLRAEFPLGEEMTHRVIAHFDNGGEDYNEEELSYEFYDHEHAQEFLDKLMMEIQ